ncbi:MarR family transcriptional regulator [Cellulosimicrobium arenosum]|uniref:MarR family transcriptional regulator n=1 Tax=Cellulosimicrobium arenosum TaxID=2708133 RepID=A0A927G8F5_9MICO|nr:MarR family transcriptional regulator [Cellulosimicrobium arenosum]MBD8078853.1 MarR family transcriptional regulator [Cellulosimicrobium arenosum]
MISALDDLARVQRESAARIARDLDLPRAALGMLRMLDRCGSVQVSDIAAMLRVDLSVASRQVSHLVDDGLARRTVDDDDRRARTVELTEAGRHVMRRSDEIVHRISSELFASWTDDEIDEATQQVTRVTAAVADGLTTPTTPLAPADPATSKEHHTA